MFQEAPPLRLLAADELSARKPDGLAALLPALAGHGARTLVANLNASFLGLEHGGRILPVAVNDSRKDRCFLTSPTAHYADYAGEIMRGAVGGRLSPFLAAMLASTRLTLGAAGADRIAWVNCWPVWTCPYPDTAELDIPALTALLTRRFPDHLIGFRTLNRLFHADLIDRLERSGYVMVPANHTFVCDFADPQAPLVKSLRRDLNHLKKTDYRIVGHDDLGPADIPRIAALYRSLNIDKYTPLNPQFTEAFFGLLHTTGAARLTGLRSPSGSLDGIIGNVDLGGVVINLFTGYDTSVGREARLYPLLLALIFRQAIDGRMGLNLGSAAGGASDFKRMRGATPVLEYNACYVRHLPWHRRALIAAFKSSMEGLGLAMMDRFDI